MAINLKNKVDKKIILKYVNESDYKKGKEYYPNYIRHIGKSKFGKTIVNDFFVESERTYRYYTCQVITNKMTGELEDFKCHCPQFDSFGSCKHIAACMINYADDIFIVKLTEEQIEDATKQIFSHFETLPVERKVKEEVRLNINLVTYFNETSGRTALELKMKVGTKRLYMCTSSKFNSFLSAVKEGRIYYFGKEFTYDPDCHYFSNDNQKFMDFLINLYDLRTSNNRYGDMTLISGNNNIKLLLKNLEGLVYSINDYKITEISNDFPFKNELVKEKDKYKLKFNFGDEYHLITEDYEYIQIKNTLYHLNSGEREFISTMLNNAIEELIFKNNEKKRFINNILPMVKGNIEIDDNIDDIKVTKKISAKLYFDLYYDKIICNVKIYYDDVEVDYFDKDSSVLRDALYENEIIDELTRYNFVIENDKLLLESLENIGKFLEEDLIEITKKYETYTSEKLKNVNIIKKTKVRSTFSIGQDNIMSYSFDLGDIKENEIVNILDALKDNKKYYRLKSGDIINLEEDNDLQELQKLTDDMNLSKKDIEKGNGVIPKYRAIYLDSLKNNKYHIIDTNNLFDELIGKFNKYKDSEVGLSKKEKGILREYQVDGVKWLCNIDRTGFGGILADEMGLGKSIQTIYYIKEMLKEDGDSKFLIVVPTSLVYNWKNEFNKFEPNMKFELIVGNRQNRRVLFENMNDMNIMITTYGLLREDREYYKDIKFRAMIIDEAQNIKNPDTEITKTVKSINAVTKFALTGTPIENSVGELWSIFDYVMPGFLANLKTFESKYKVKEFDEETNQKLEGLNRLVSPFILRRRKKDVILELPNKIENNIYVSLRKEQKKIYLAELEKVNREMEEIMLTGGIAKARFLILKLLTKLRQICIDPRIIYGDYDGGSGKLEEFVKVVTESVDNGHKILVFTSFRKGLEIAREELLRENITSYVIDGSVSSKKRMELVDKFNEDDTNVFFIMLKAGGTGLNLTSADIVIHLDLWWNPQAENQATDRAHRIGQKNTVQVIRFISKGTIEEKILDLQNKKKILSDKLIDENKGENSFSKLTERDIKELLTYENKDEE